MRQFVLANSLGLQGSFKLMIFMIAGKNKKSASLYDMKLDNPIITQVGGFVKQ